MGREIRNVLAALKRLDDDFNLIEENDTILVELNDKESSYVLLFSLRLYSYFSKKNHKLRAIFFDYGNKDYSSAKIFAERFNIPFETFDASYIKETLDTYYQNGRKKDLSSVYQKLKRTALINYAKDNKINKIALDTSEDDFNLNFFNSLIKQGKLSSLKPMAKINKEVKIIRPFLYVGDKNIQEIFSSENMKTPPKFFYDYDNDKSFLDNIYNKDKNAKANIQKALFESKKFNFPFEDLLMKTEDNECHFKPIAKVNSEAEYRLLNPKAEEHYALYRADKPIAAISLNKKLNHYLEIVKFVGDTENKKILLNQLLNLKAKKMHPLILVLKYPTKDALILGFSKKYDVYYKKEKYLIRK